MGILNYLPKFKVVEPNRLTGLVAGHIISQFKLDPADALIAGTGDTRHIENGYIVGLDKDGELKKYAGKGQPFLVYTEELVTFLDGNNRFATFADGYGDIYPRAVALYVGDVFTTNNYAGTGKYAKIANGVLTLTDTGADAVFLVEDAYLANGDPAKKFIYVGPQA